MPNGTSHPGGSDTNCNKLPRSLDTSLHRGVEQADPCIQHSGSLGDEGCPLQSPDSLGGGEAPACPPSPHSSNVPSCFDQFHSDSPGRYSNSNRSCDQLAGSCDQLQSEGIVRNSYDSSTVNSAEGESVAKQKRRRRRAQQAREQHTRDQATNTDLSSNGTSLHCLHYYLTYSWHSFVAIILKIFNRISCFINHFVAFHRVVTEYGEIFSKTFRLCD